MKIIFGLAILLIIGIVGAVVLNLYFDKPIRRKYLWITLGVFVMALAVVAYCTEPMESDDLFRHFAEIGRMRNQGINYVIERANYRMNPIINFIFYFVALMNNNYLLPMITVLIVYGIHLSLSVKIYEKFNISSRILCLYLLLFFALIPVRFCISNVRIIMAFAIAFIAIYRDYFEDNRNIITLALYLAPILIHSSAVIVVGLRILDIKFFRIYKIRYILLFWSLMSNKIADYLFKIPTLFSRDLSMRIKIYMGSSEYLMDKRLFIVQALVLLGIYVLNSIIIKRSKSEDDKTIRRYLEFVQMVILFTAGSFLSQVLYMRLGYFIAFLILPTLSYGYNILKEKFNRGELLIIIPSAIVILGLFAHQAVNAIVYWRLWI